MFDNYLFYMMTDWAIYYQQNKHLPLNKIMENYNKLLLEFNERLYIVNQQSQNVGSGPGGSDSVVADLIYSSLSAAGQSSFNSTAVGNFFSVSAADYASVFSSVTGATKYAMTDSQLNEDGGDAWSGGFAFSLAASVSTIPASSYVIGFAARSDDVSAGTVTPLISTTYTGSYSAVSNSPTFAAGSPSAVQYYIRRNPQTSTASTSYLALVSTLNRRRGSTLFNSFYSAASPYNSWTSYNNAKAPVQQFIATTTKCWI